MYTDFHAEQAIIRIREREAERDRLIRLSEQMIASYYKMIDDLSLECEQNNVQDKTSLEEYIKTVKTHKTDTQESYKLASGTIQIKQQKPEIVRDNAKLLEYIKQDDLSRTMYIKTTETVDWESFKKLLVQQGDKYIDLDGQVVDGVELKPREPKFEIKFAKEKESAE